MKPEGIYAVEYKLSMFAYVDMDTDPPTITRVVVDDENPGKPVFIETDGGTIAISEGSDEWDAIVAAVDGPEAEWPAWQFGW